MTRLARAALALAARGFHVFPLEDRGKRPRIKAWPEKATTDPETVRGWWTQWPEANIGVATGKFGADGEALLVLDVDVKDGRDGMASLEALDVLGGETPATWRVATPTGGLHLYFVVPSPLPNSVNKLGDGLDVRSGGGYVVGPGSVTDVGRYRLIREEGGEA